MPSGICRKTFINFFFLFYGMKLLCFTDTHTSEKVLASIRKKVDKDKPDLLICTGDVSLFSRGLNEFFKRIEKFKIPMVFIHGNHELESEIRKIAKNYAYVKFVHKNGYRFGDFLFVGYGGGGFSNVYPDFEQFIPKIKERLKKEDKLILLTHAPPYGTKLDILPYFGHVGSKSATKAIKELKPKLVLCGHLHENFHKMDKIGQTLIINPGPDGMIIEI